MVADWHALMSEYENPAQLRKNAYEMVKDWVACGIDPVASVVFVQSEVPEHLELAMVFSIITPLAWLERCPTYKEQLKELKGRDITTYGFLGYPVLQAADIAVYRANAVPVGVDQLPHIELTREIIRRFHYLYRKEIFPEPEGLLTPVPKLLGLDNRKMSKSYDNYVALADTPDAVRKKVAQMITDPQRIKLQDRGHPDICNVFSYYKVFTDEKVTAEVRDWCTHAKKGCTACKQNLADTIIEFLRPIQTKRSKIRHADVDDILKDGNRRAQAVAAETMRTTRELIGLVKRGTPVNPALPE